jgi:hypothetical protein
MTVRLRALAGLLGVLLLAACATPDPTPKYPELTFIQKPKIRLDVARIEVINEHQMPVKRPNVEHLMPVAPCPAAERWARDVLVPVGRTGVAVFVISDAAVTETKLKKTEGLKGAFTTDQAERYDGRLAARIDLRDAFDRVVASAEAVTTKSQTVPENISPNDRAKTWYGMTEAMMENFDAIMHQEAQRYLAQHMR